MSEVVVEKPGVGRMTFHVDESGLPYAAACECPDGMVVDAENWLEVWEWAEDAGLEFTRPYLCEECDQPEHMCSC